MVLIPTTYQATFMKDHGKKISATICTGLDTKMVKIQASSFFTEDPSGTSVMEMAEFLKDFGIDYGKEFSNFSHLVLFFSDDFSCIFSLEQLVKQSTLEILQKLATELPLFSTAPFND